MGTPAITTRGIKENNISNIVDLIDRIVLNHNDESVISSTKKEVNNLMNKYPIFATNWLIQLT